jgi:hypothetical protein
MCMPYPIHANSCHETSFNISKLMAIYLANSAILICCCRCWTWQSWQRSRGLRPGRGVKCPDIVAFEGLSTGTNREKWMHASTEFPIYRPIESWNLKTLRQDWRSIYTSLWATWCCSSLHVQLCRMSFKMCLNITFLPDCSGRLPSVSFLHVFVCWGQAGDTQYLDNSSQTWNRAILGWLRIIIPVTSHSNNCSGQYSIVMWPSPQWRQSSS